MAKFQALEAPEIRFLLSRDKSEILKARQRANSAKNLKLNSQSIALIDQSQKLQRTYAVGRSALGPAS